MMTSIVAHAGVVSVCARAAGSSKAQRPVLVRPSNLPVNIRRVATMQQRPRRHALSVCAASEETSTELADAASPAAAPAPPKPAPASKPGQGKPPINPVFLAAGDFAAAVLITIVARGAAGADIISPGTIAAIPPFVIGWVGAGYLAGDYDADSPNAALWGDVPRAMTTGALTWFSGSAFAILLRNVEGNMMTFPPALNEQVEFAGGLGLICAFRAAVAVAKPGAGDKL